MFEKVYTHEYMDDWEKFNEAFLPKTKGFTVA